MESKSTVLLACMVWAVSGSLCHASAQSDGVQAQADAAYARYVQLRTDILSGKAPPSAYSGVEKWLRLSQQAPDPRRQELFRREFDDQFGRYSLYAAGRTYAQGLAERASDIVLRRVLIDVAAVDAANTLWLKAQLDQIGWFTISRYGKDADDTASLIVNHSDQAPEFQAEVVEKLGALLKTKDTDPQNYAYLFDIVALNHGRLQRYGTQMTCSASGVWKPRPVEAPAELDARRAEVGLSPEAEYEKSGAQLCK